MPRGTDNAIKIADGNIERIIFSNFSVKSKFPRQPSTAGPKETSLTHLNNSMPGTGSGWDCGSLAQGEWIQEQNFIWCIKIPKFRCQYDELNKILLVVCSVLLDSRFAVNPWWFVEDNKLNTPDNSAYIPGDVLWCYPTNWSLVKQHLMLGKMYSVPK